MAVGTVSNDDKFILYQINLALRIVPLHPGSNMVAKLDASGNSAVVIRAATVVDEVPILASYGLAREPNGVISWARGSPHHPRHWPFGRKVYDTALIILLELYT